MHNNTVHVSRGETPSYLFEFFQAEETGPRVDLTGATIVVSSNMPNAKVLSYTPVDPANGSISVALTKALTLSLKKFTQYWLKVEVTTANGNAHNAELVISVQ